MYRTKVKGVTFNILKKPSGNGGGGGGEGRDRHVRDTRVNVCTAWPQPGLLELPEARQLLRRLLAGLQHRPSHICVSAKETSQWPKSSLGQHSAATDGWERLNRKCSGHVAVLWSTGNSSVCSRHCNTVV